MRTFHTVPSDRPNRNTYGSTDPHQSAPAVIGAGGMQFGMSERSALVTPEAASTLRSLKLWRTHNALPSPVRKSPKSSFDALRNPVAVRVASSRRKTANREPGE